MVAIENQQFNMLCSQRGGKLRGTFDPVTMSGMAGIAQRAVYECNIILIFGQDGYRYAMAAVQLAVLADAGGIRTHPGSFEEKLV